MSQHHALEAKAATAAESAARLHAYLPHAVEHRARRVPTHTAHPPHFTEGIEENHASAHHQRVAEASSTMCMVSFDGDADPHCRPWLNGATGGGQPNACGYLSFDGDGFDAFPHSFKFDESEGPSHKPGKHAGKHTNARRPVVPAHGPASLEAPVLPDGPSA